MLRYKFDILTALKNNGWTTYRIRKEKLFSEATVQKFRDKEMVSWQNISKICEVLNCQPGDFLEYVPDVKITEGE